MGGWVYNRMDSWEDGGIVGWVYPGCFSVAYLVGRMVL